MGMPYALKTRCPKSSLIESLLTTSSDVLVQWYLKNRWTFQSKDPREETVLESNDLSDEISIQSTGQQQRKNRCAAQPPAPKLTMAPGRPHRRV